MRLGIGIGLNNFRKTGTGGTGPIISAPSQFTAGQWTLADSPSAGGDTLSLNVTELPSNGGSAITALQYSVGGGATKTLSGVGTGARLITVLASTAASVELWAVNAIGSGARSTAKVATPTVATVAADYVVTTDAEYAAVMANIAATLNGKILEFSGTNFTSLSVNGKDFATGFTMRCAAGAAVQQVSISGTASNLIFDGMNFKMKGWPSNYKSMAAFNTCVVNKITFRNCVFAHGYGVSLVDFNRTAEYPEYTRIDHNLTATTTSAATALTWQDPAMTSASVYMFNNGSNPVYVKLGGAGVVATTADKLVAVGTGYEYTTSANPTTDTHVAVISTGGSTAVNIRTEIGMSRYVADAFSGSGSANIGDITVENCTFQNINNGIKGLGKPTVSQTIRGNVFKNVYQDLIAISGAGATKTSILNNFGQTGFARSGVAQDRFGDAADPHGDAIQMFGSSTPIATSAINDITIAGNVFYKGLVRSGQQNQGAFISDNDWSPSFKGISVIGNAFLGGAVNGICSGESIYPAEDIYTYGNIVADQDALASGTSSIRTYVPTTSPVYDGYNILQARNAEAGEITSDNSLLVSAAASSSALFPNWANLPTASSRSEVEAALAVGAEGVGLGYVAAKSKLNFAATTAETFVDWNNLPSGVEWGDLVSQPASTVTTLPLRKVLNKRASQTVSVSAGTEWRSVATDGTTEVQAWTSTSGTIATGQYIQIRGTTSAASLGSATLGVTINGFLQQTTLTNAVTAPAVYHTQSGTGPYFRDPANSTPASTTKMEWKANIYPTAYPAGTSKLFTQESLGCDLEINSSGILRMIIKDGSNTSVVVGPSSSSVALTLNQWQTVEYVVDQVAGTASASINGTVVVSITWTPGASAYFVTAREITMLATSTGGNPLPSGWQVEYAECYLTTSGVRSLRKRIDGNAATVNADSWKGGGSAT